MGHRMSSLPIAQFCAQSPRLSVGSGRPAAMSSAFHALCAADGETPLAALTDAETEEVKSWHKPEPCVLLSPHDGSRLNLRYEQSEREVEVGLTSTGGDCDASNPRILTLGHLDMAWNSTPVAVVADIKKTRWTTLDGPDSLQLASYGAAWAARHDCEWIWTGVWHAKEGTWAWGEPYRVDSEKAMKAWERIEHAARNDSKEFSTGSHCSSCWSRLRCPAHMIQGDLTESILSPMSEEEPSDEDALKLLLWCDRDDDAKEAAKGWLKELARRRGGLRDPKTGKVWRPIECKGRGGFDVNGLSAEYPQVAEKYRTAGAPFQQFRWMKS